MQTTSNVIDKNWKALIKPSKLEVSISDHKRPERPTNQ